MMQKLQRFGGAMFTPILLFSFSGIILSFSILFQNEMIMGSLAADGALWSSIWSIIESGGWTVFNQIELLFVIGIPLGLAKKANGRAAMESFVIYMTWNNFIARILEIFGANFGVDYSMDPGGTSGLKFIGSVKTLDTNIIGAIAIAAITVWIHNKFFDVKLPDWLGVFQGSVFVYIIGFFVMLPTAFLTAWIWPLIQGVIASLQGWMAASGVFGVWVYVFLERILIPTGLHHFIYQPFIYGPAVVEGGLERAWLQSLNQMASNPAPLIEQFPMGGFGLHNMSKIFAPIGIAGAFYFTADGDKKQEVLSLVIPTAFTAIMAGITEPFEFTFLFIAPQLFLVHSLLAATLAGTMYLFGVAGDFGSGLIALSSKFIIPMWANHRGVIFTWLIIGLVFSGIYFGVFSFLIKRFDFKTPGREEDEEVKMYSKQDYREREQTEALASASVTTQKEKPAKGGFAAQAADYVNYLGGEENILEVNNCATRLRVTVDNPDLLAPDKAFKEIGAHGVVRNGKAIQVIIGLDVPNVREEVDKYLNRRHSEA